MELKIKIKDKKVYDSLVQFLKSLGIDVSVKELAEKKNKAKKYPLKGTLLKYDDPFGPSVNPQDWDAAK